MDSVSKTLYIPLYGKSFVSKRGIILKDPKAEEIWASEGFPLKGKSASKWLSFYMGMRAAVFDRWVKEQLAELSDAAVLHLGCGMDSRILRVGDESHSWYDIDFPEVIAERKKYYRETVSPLYVIYFVLRQCKELIMKRAMSLIGHSSFFRGLCVRENITLNNPG